MEQRSSGCLAVSGVSCAAVQDAEHIAGKRIIFYGDICTTGLQLNVVAKRLRQDWGAVSVVGVYLARHAWRY